MRKLFGDTACLVFIVAILINMGAYGNTGEVWKTNGPSLQVLSTPITGANITGDKPGVTNYGVSCSPSQVVDLTAPETVTVGAVRYDFVQWTGDGTPAGHDVQVTMNVNKTVTAEYAIREHTLNVQSTPITGAVITGDKPGTTNYGATCDDQEVVNLTAPETVTVGDVRYDFVQWTGDGTPVGHDVQVTMNDNKTVTAEYAIRQHTLNVESTPITGAVITGDKPGTTNYDATCDDQEVVNLTAPETVTVGAVRYDFVQWTVTVGVTGAEQLVITGDPSGHDVQITMDDDKTAVAEYAIRQHTLNVESTPITGAVITGGKPGTTNYGAICDDQEVVNLTAPEVIVDPVEGIHTFLQWVVNAVDQPVGQTTVQITMDIGYTATAVYEWLNPVAYCPETGHYYEIVVAGLNWPTNDTNGIEQENSVHGIDWPTARDEAETRTFVDVNGHLATINSEEERDFINGLLLTPPYWNEEGVALWLGGYQPDESPEPAGNWQWITDEPWTGSDWHLGQPDDADGDDNLLVYRLDAGSDAGWNDEPGASLHVGYIVEYEQPAEPILYVDDDADDDPGPGDPTISDPKENGSAYHPFDSIQEAIDAASGSPAAPVSIHPAPPMPDLIIVLNGTFTGPGNHDIDFGGQALHLRSQNGAGSSTIDCEEAGRGFYFHSGEDADSIVEGFTITNGHATGLPVDNFHSGEDANSIVEGSTITTSNTTVLPVDNCGGGVFCDVSSPTIIDNVIMGNTADDLGGGIFCRDGAPTVTGNAIRQNVAGHGAGVYVSTAAPTLANNTITRNEAVYRGGGLFCFRMTDGTIENNTLEGNTASQDGGGLYCSLTVRTVANSILWNNEAPSGPQIYVASVSTLTVSYCDVEGADADVVVEGDCALVWGPDNKNVDPLFADADGGDYHLKSEHGRWDPDAAVGPASIGSEDAAEAGDWVNDDVTSQCIDAGNPAGGYGNEQEPNGRRLNMGAYGNTDEASKSVWLLTVQSTPVTGASITGDKPGDTDYIAGCADEDVVTLTAPATTTVGAVRYDFVQWTGDGVPAGQDVQLTMDDYKTVTAEYTIRQHTLSVESTPITGAGITGDKPGTTNYGATCDDQEVVNLTAPATVTVGDVRYDFVEWTGDGTPAGQDVQVTVDGDKTVMAEYAIRQQALTVESTLVTDVSITGDKPGTTDYGAACDDHEVVNLTAPATVTVGDVHYDFVQWTVTAGVAGAGQLTIAGAPVGQDVQVTMDDDKTVTAEYAIRQQTLNVQSIPVAGAGITGDKPGTTDYDAACDDQEVVDLTAPATVTAAGDVRYDFVQWTGDGTPAGQDVQVTMDDEKTVTAEYVIREHTLNVESTPITDVSITGDKPGTTDYAPTCDDQEVVNLTAPATVMVGDVRYDFVQWTGDGVAGGQDVQVTLDGDKTVTVHYAIRQQTLDVQSTPITGASITGDKPGTTNYSAACDDQQVVNLTAPGTVLVGDVRYDFVQWTGDGAPVARNVQVTMDGAKTVTAEYTIRQYTLDVESTPMSSVEITGDKPGTTDYSAVCDDQEVVNLTAPATVTLGDVRYDFVEWIDDGVPAGQDVQVTIDGNMTVTAEYAIRRHTLDVESTPITGVDITGDEPGTTNYSIGCDDQDVVDLTAPATVTVGDVDYRFLQWTVSSLGDAQVTGEVLLPDELDLQVTMDTDKTVTAEYTAKPHILKVQSTPFTGVGITGDKPGTTNYPVGCDEQEVVNLTAPATIMVGDVPYDFLQWTGDGTPAGQDVQVTMDGDKTVTAEYVLGQHTLTVESTPTTGVEITGDKPGTTNYGATCDNQEVVNLCAPQCVEAAVCYEFVRFVVDSVEQPEGQSCVEMTMDTDRTVVAEYERFMGDVTGDCAVDILDMISVRNKLNKDVGTDDNWKADLDDNGSINILDLIIVRNNLGNVCE